MAAAGPVGGVVPSSAAAAPGTVAAIAPAAGAGAPASRAPGAPPILAFSDPVYEVASGQNFDIKLMGANLEGAASVPLEVLYNPQLLSYVGGAKGDVAADSFNSTADASRGALNISLSLSAGATQPANAVLARVTMRGEKAGVSYLVYRVPAIKTESGEVLNAQVRAARVVVK